MKKIFTQHTEPWIIGGGVLGAFVFALIMSFLSFSTKTSSFHLFSPAHAQDIQMNYASPKPIYPQNSRYWIDGRPVQDLPPVYVYPTKQQKR